MMAAWFLVASLLSFAPLETPVATLALASAKAAGEADKVQVLRGLVYAVHDEQKLLLDAYLPAGKGPFPVVLVVHGGAWRTGSRVQIAHYATHLAQKGYAALSIDYRLAPAHPFPAQIQDCRCALRWITAHAQEYRLDVDRVGAIGYSAGGHLVALLGTTPEVKEFDATCECAVQPARLRAIVAGGAPCDFRQLPQESTYRSFLFGGTRAEKPDLYKLASPAAHISRDDPPILFFHGSQDMLVDIQEPQAMVTGLQEAGVTSELYVVEGAGHLLATVRMDGLVRATEFFDVHLKP